MKALDQRYLLVGLMFVCTLASGFFLSRSGKPYGTVLFNLHKLIAVGAIILTGVIINRMRSGIAIQPLALSAMIVAGLLFLTLIATGGMLSIGKPDFAAILTIHRIVPLVAVLFTAASIYFVAAARPLPIDF